jgi:formylglycine-generating enzyme required for sulfatase activity/serine/threonine protein kinase
MPASSTSFSARARDVFAEIVREHESARDATRARDTRGDLDREVERDTEGISDAEVDLERACAAHPDLELELRALHASWSRLNGVLARIGVEERDESVATHDRSSDARTRRDLERLGDSQRTRYAVLEEVARGGMGVVLRVRDEHLERDLAMKLVRGDGASARGGWRTLARFLAEARLAGRLDHPGIVPIHDLGVDARGRAYFTMPLVRGTKLSDVIELVHARRRARRSLWTRERALEALLKVCDTIAYAHSAGVVHRDLKPDNVMIGRFGETYVMDWGLARVVESTEIDGHRDDTARERASSDEHAQHGDATPASRGTYADSHPTRDGDVLGTPAYMAPEQAAGQGATAQADVYSVGAILYHLLAGRAPYARLDDDATMQRDVLAAVRAGPPDPLERTAPDAAPELAAICDKAMERSLARRYADMRAMSDDLRAYMEGRVVRAHDAGTAAELKKWIARNRALSAAIAAALLLAIGGFSAVSYVQASSKNEILKLADARRIDVLVRRADSLWPAVPENAEAMVAWLAEAEALLENGALHERTLREMRERVHGSTHSSNEAQWQFESQTRLVADLDRLADPDPRRGLIANVRARLADARAVRAASLDDHAAEWQAAIESIADERACPLYHGLRIAPQLGLVPIGRDPRSTLWEFAHLPSGAPARRDAHGALVIGADTGPETGIVLVLIPGGTATIGSKPPRPGQPADAATDPLARGEELPARTLELAPFFLGKYELSRAQWERWCARAGASEFVANAPSNAGGPGHARDSGTHPARGISWREATHELEHMGLVLPTEAQWEHAARAGTNTRWWCGNEPRLLADAANLATGIDGALPFTDTFDETAPIDALRPNPWGLHHVIGNISEWTEDCFAPHHEDAFRAGDGLALAVDAGLRCVRGGSYKSSAASARSASRMGVAPDNHDREIGVRAARAIDR